MADLLQGLEVLEESDIVGAKLDLENLYKYSVGELRFWLQCRGDSLKKCTLKKRYYKQVSMMKMRGVYMIIISKA